MDVVWHDYPGAQFVMSAVVEAECRISKPGKPRLLQRAFSPPFVQVGLQLFAAIVFVFNFQQRLPFRTQRCWEGVGDVESDHLCESWFIAMWQKPRSCQPLKPALA